MIESPTLFGYPRVMSMHILAMVLHIVSASLAFAVYSESNLSADVVTPHFKYVYDTKIGVETSYSVWLTTSVPFLIFLNEALTAGSHLVGSALWFFGFRERADSIRRWVEYGITAGLLEFAILLGMGERNGWVLISVLVLNIIIQLSGYQIDDHLYEGKDATSGLLQKITTTSEER